MRRALPVTPRSDPRRPVLRADAEMLTCPRHLSASRIQPWLDASAQERLELCRKWNSDTRSPAVRQADPRGRNPNPRLEHGRKCEPIAVGEFRDLSGIPADLFKQCKFREHPDRSLKYIGAEPDALVGDNFILEVKAPFKAIDDGNAEIELNNHDLLQVYVQIQCFPGRKVIVIHYCEEYLHIWLVEPDDLTLWKALLPELQKYADMVDRGCKPARQYDTMSGENKRRITEALREYRKKCVFKMVCPRKESAYIEWKLASAEPATNPKTFTLIDRLLVPTVLLADKPHFLNFAERYLRVRWLDGDKTAFYEGSDPPRGGLVSYGFHAHPLDPAHFPTGADAWGVVS